MTRVALVGCGDYEMEHVRKAIMRGLSFFGGAESIFRGKRTILLKPNLLVGEVPEKAITTHPVIVEGVSEILLEKGFRLGYGDSSGFGSVESVAKKTGLYSVGERKGLSCVNFSERSEVSFPAGRQNKSFIISRGILQYDAVLSLPKWKTHGFTRVTGAVKNQFGCIPGILKREYHFKMPDVIHFSRMLVDLNLLVRPRFFIMDAIVAMDGNGPRSGKPQLMGVLGFSEDPVALDATFSRLIALDPRYVPTCVEGERGNLGTWQEESIELVGDDFSHFTYPNFDVRREPVDVYQKNGSFRSLLINHFISRPVIEVSKCKRCGVCWEVCPAHPKALEWSDHALPPQHLYRLCIRCY
ncbi:MAG: DUF362 domain-containing protein, partial [Atribacterota bacterium]